MDKHDYFFTPDQIDEQIEQGSGPWQSTSEARLLAEMQQVAGLIRASQERSLQRTWTRLQERNRRSAGSLPHQRREQDMREQETISFPQRGRQLERKAPHSVARVLGSLVAAVVVLLLILTWAMLLPALRTHSQGSSVGSGGKNLTPQAKPSAISSHAKRLCAYTDTRAADANFIINYSLDWSTTGSIAFTHRDSVVLKGADCALDSGYHDNLSNPQCAVWSPDGKQLLALTLPTVNGQTGLDLQMVNDRGQVQGTVVLAAPGGPMGSVAPVGGWLSSQANLSDNKSTFWGPAWSPDGKKFSAIFNPSGSAYYLMTWTTQGQTRVLNQSLNLSGEPIHSVAWSPDGQYVAITTDKSESGVRLFNARTGSFVKSLARGGISTITNLAWSPDGQELATGSNDDLVRIWQVATGAQRFSLTGASGATVFERDFQIAWSPDGKKIVAGDGQTIVWEVSSGKVIAHIQSADQIVVALAWSPDSQKVATLSASRTLGTQTKATLETWSL